ncbi:hypothetical protein J6590_023266 [Homalodisca vitripennis]|nr:hypothetical protein J6590_023266 [Homalodisca vitripennis]
MNNYVDESCLCPPQPSRNVIRVLSPSITNLITEEQTHEYCPIDLDNFTDCWRGLCSTRCRTLAHVPNDQYVTFAGKADEVQGDLPSPTASQCRWSPP